MAPIKVALVGLSASAITAWAANAHLPYLLSERGRQHYELVALLNSSVAAAEAAKAHFKLPSHVKAYGDPNALAADPDVELVVVSTRVENHIPTIEPSVRAGKSAYIEWPIAESSARAASLLNGKPGGVFPDSIVGLQGRYSPVVLKLKALIRSGRIGRVLSSDVRTYGFPFPRDALPESLASFIDRRTGGNTVVNAYTHFLSHVHGVLGDFAEGFQSRLQIQRQSVTILGKDFVPVRKAQSDVPDLVVVHGKLAPGHSDIAEDATLSVYYRSGPPFKGDPPFVWTINGEKGELRIVLPAGLANPLDLLFTIELHDHATDEVEKVEWDWEEWQKELPIPARSVGVLYERYARWVENGKSGDKLPEELDWQRIHDAVAKHKELETMFAQFDAQK